jgi:hypothetical protein
MAGKTAGEFYGKVFSMQTGSSKGAVDHGNVSCLLQKMGGRSKAK